MKTNNNYSEIKKMCVTPLYSLEEIFTNNWFFKIPTYQRGYVWETREDSIKDKEADKQLDKFWQDIINCKENKNHYTGQLVLQKLTSEELIQEGLNRPFNDIKGDKYAFYVVDGQQRLTTSLILLSILIKKLGNEIENNDNYLTLKGQYRLSYQNKSEKYNETLKYILTGDNFAEIENNQDNIYFEKLNKAKEFFESKVDERNNEELKNIFNIFMNNINFNILFVNSDNNNDGALLDAEELFESINNRGKALTKLEILKNRLFFIYKNDTHKNKNDSKSLDESSLIGSWSTIYNNLGLAAKNNELANCLGDDDFLKAHWVIYKDNYDKASDEYIFDSQILKQFKEDLTEDEVQNTLQYVKTLTEFSRCWKYLHNAETLSEYNITQDMTKKEPKTYNEYKTKLIKILSQLNKIDKDIYIKAFIISILYQSICLKNILIEDLISALEFIEKYLFVAKYIAFKKDFGFAISLANDIYKSTKNDVLLVLQSSLQSFVTPKINGNKNKNEDKLLTNLLSEKSLTNWMNEFTNIEGKHTFYTWSGLPYFLYSLNNDVQGQYGDINYRSLVVNKQKTIEHIYPQNTTGRISEEDREYWHEAVDKFLTKEAKKYAVNALGNFLPLSQEINSSVSNNMYPKKIGKLDGGIKNTYYNGSALAIDLANNYSHWTINDIIDRTLKMLKKIEEKWFDFSCITFSNGYTGISNYILNNKEIVRKYNFSKTDHIKAINFNNEPKMTTKKRYRVNKNCLEDLVKKLKNNELNILQNK